MKLVLFAVFAFVLFSCGVSSVDDLSEKVNTINPLNDSLKKPVSKNQKEDSIEIKELIEQYALNKIDTFDVGDVNGDGKKDKAIVRPLTMFYQNHKMDSQYVKIHFTCNIPDIKHYPGFRGLVVNVGDLDGNKTDEILYYPDWYQSNSAGIFIYGYRNNKWILFGDGSIRRDNLADEKDPIKYLKSRVKKINNTKFQISERIWNDDDIIDSVKTIIIPR